MIKNKFKNKLKILLPYILVIIFSICVISICTYKAKINLLQKDLIKQTDTYKELSKNYYNYTYSSQLEIDMLKIETNYVKNQNKLLIETNEKLANDNKMVYLGKFTITHYCGEVGCKLCGSGNGVTASGITAQSGVTIAVDTNIIPMGSKVYINGYGHRIAQDVFGSKNKGNCIDIYVSSHEEALRLGRIHNVDVWVSTQ